ncbi:hypothetical protein [Streptomyces sp. HPF1205]|uniref:hypothetical protein n=1 Tax=Streptomyces sp. HPF1205 TaxID=2873262 RepID=UPI001CECD182|nr:hypothetical protein [Streptomyces sp. HPF1205]
MSDTYVDLGAVTVPSGVLVLAMAGRIDSWRETARPLSERALAAAALGGGHLYEFEGSEPLPWSGEAIAVRAAVGRPLRVRALTSPSPIDRRPMISLLEADLGIPWPQEQAGCPVVLGDMPVDRCGVVLGDARALDGFTGRDGEATDGLADVTYWGRHGEAAQAEFGGEPIPQHRGAGGVLGWRDVPLAEAERIAERLRAWLRDGPGKGLMVAVNKHTDLYRLKRAGLNHALLAGVVEVDGCQVLGIGWDAAEHSMYHRGERAQGQVYPATLESRDGEGVLRWTISSFSPEPDKA